jgi:hypothetical protein
MVDLDTSEFPPTNGRGSLLVTRRAASGAAGVAFPRGLQVGEAISMSFDSGSSRRAGRWQGQRGRDLQAVAWLSSSAEAASSSRA